jgi:hypothetical protein
MSLGREQRVKRGKVRLRGRGESSKGKRGLAEKGALERRECHREGNVREKGTSKRREHEKGVLKRGTRERESVCVIRKLCKREVATS